MRLPPKQQQIIALVKEGYELPDIAKELNITANTLYVHMTQIYRAYGIKEGSKDHKLLALYKLLRGEEVKG